MEVKILDSIYNINKIEAGQTECIPKLKRINFLEYEQIGSMIAFAYFYESGEELTAKQYEMIGDVCNVHCDFLKE